MPIDPLTEFAAQLRDPDYRIRYLATDALGAIGNIAAIELLIQALGDFDLRDDESRVNRHASNALVKIGPLAVPLLLDALRNKDPHNPKDGWRRYWIAQTLGWLGDRRAVEPLIDVLQEADREVCEGAAEALGRLGDRQAVEPLARKLATLKSTEGYLYTAVFEALKVLNRKGGRRRK